MATAAADHSVLPPPVRRIRPLALGGALDEAVCIVRERFGLLLVLMLITIIPWTYPMLIASFSVVEDLFRGIFDQDQARLERSFRTNLLLSPLSLIHAILLQALAIGAATHVAAEAMFGRTTTVKGTYRRLRERLFPLLGAWALSFLAVQFGTQMCLLPGLAAYLLFLFAPQAVMVEEAGPLKALGRSVILAKDNIVMVLGLAVVLFVIRTFATLIVFIVPERHTISILFSVINGMMLALEMAAATVLYFSCRCRMENLDLNLLVGEVVAGETTPETEPELPAAGNFGEPRDQGMEAP